MSTEFNRESYCETFKVCADKLRELYLQTVSLGTNLDTRVQIGEYRTMRISGPRQCGKTAWIIDKCWIGDLIVLKDQDHAKTFFDTLEESIHAVGKYVRVVCLEELEAELEKGTEINNIFIDDATSALDFISLQQLIEKVEKRLAKAGMIYLIG